MVLSKPFALSLLGLCGAYTISVPDECDEYIVTQYQPIEFVFDGVAVSPSVTTITRTITVPGNDDVNPPSSTPPVSSGPVSRFASTTTVPWTGNFTTTVTGASTPGGGPPPVTVKTPTRRASTTAGPTDPTYITTTATGTASTPYTVTGAPETPGGDIPVTVFVPRLRYVTTTTTGTATAPYTVTGTPGTPGGDIPVTVFQPPPDYSTTTVTGTVTAPYTVTGTPETPGGDVPVTVFVPPPSYSTTTVTGTASTPYTVTGTPETLGGDVPVTIFTPPPGYTTTTSTGTATTPFTVTATTTDESGKTPVTVVVPNACTPGMKWAFYNMEQSDNDEQTAPGAIPVNTDANADWVENTFDPAVAVQGQSPDSTGETEQFGVQKNCYDDVPTIYGESQEGAVSEYILGQQIGYFHPAKSGTYTFSLDAVDDALYIWTGDVAKSGFNKDNYAIINSYTTEGETVLKPLEFNEGDYVPMRLLWVNAQACGSAKVTVTDPDGETVASWDGPLSGDLLVFGCSDDVNAPPFDF